MQRPEFLECAEDNEWEEWKAVHARTGMSTSPANSVKNFCADCTPAYFEHNAERGLCFQARVQDGEISLDDVYEMLKNEM